MMKKLFFILIFLVLTTNNTYAFDCSQLKADPIVIVMASYGQLTYNHEKSTDEITELAKKFNLVETGLFAQGLSTVNVNFDISVDTFSRPVGENEYCLTPVKITIFLGLDTPTVYIANNLKEDTCEYNQVLRHEKVHQQINKTTLEYYLPIFKDATTAIVQKISPRYFNNIEDIKKMTENITIEYNQKLMPLVDFIKKEMLSEQQKLDNPKNYQFESTLCP
jgi:hypothetical protein